MTLKLYGLGFSGNVMRAIFTLEEKEVDDYSIVDVNLWTGEHKRPEFLKLHVCFHCHPFGKIPVLEDGNFILYESRAICRYICEKFESQGNTTLLGKNAEERALVNQWLEVEAQSFNPTVSTIVFQLVFTSRWGGTPNEDLVAEQQPKLEKLLDIYEAHLAIHKYLAGDFFSLAEVCHLPQLHNLINVAKKGDGITSQEHLNAWWQDISSRPAWKKVLEHQKEGNLYGIHLI